MTREEARAVVKKDGLLIDTLPKKYRDDKEIVLLAVSQNWEAIDKCAVEYLKDKDVMLKVLSNPEGANRWAKDLRGHLYSDRDIAMAVFQHSLEAEYNRNSYFYYFAMASEALKDDEELAWKVLESQGSLHLGLLSERLQDNKELVLAIMERAPGSMLSHASSRLKDDEDVVRASLTSCGIQYASDRIKSNDDIVRASLFVSPLSLNYLPDYQDNKEFVLIAVSRNGGSLDAVSERLRGDREVAIAALKSPTPFSTWYPVLHIFPEFIQKDREVVRVAYMKNLNSLEFADEELLNDRDFMLEAFKHNAQAHLYFGESLKKDIPFMLQAGLLGDAGLFKIERFPVK